MLDVEEGCEGGGEGGVGGRHCWLGVSWMGFGWERVYGVDVD